MTDAEIKAAADKVTKIGSSQMTERVAKLLRQAEGAEPGSPEHETFMEKAIALGAAYSIDLAVARAATAKQERVEVPEDRTFQVSDFKGRRRKQGTEHMADLMIAILRANDCQILVSHSRINIFGHGMPSDLDLSERLFALLAPQMVVEADASLKRGDNKVVIRTPKTKRVEIPIADRAWDGYDAKKGCYYDSFEDCTYIDHNGVLQIDQEATVEREDAWKRVNTWDNDRKVRLPPSHKNVPVLDDFGNQIIEEKAVSTTDGRIWRANMYQAFINRIRYRLAEAKKQALKDAGIDVANDSDSRAVALRDKTKEVEDSYREKNRVVLENIERRKKKGYTGAEVSTYDHQAAITGDRAAQAARLGNEKDLDHG